MSLHQNKVILITILTAILAVNSNSQSHSPKLFVLLDQWIPDLQNEMFNVNNDPETRLTRTKRIGSLSIVNSLDVLRQRVLLELARKKALQDQRQIDANRRFLETVGKRSVRPYNSDSAKDISGRIRSGLEYSIEQGWLPDPVFRERNEE